MRNRLCAAVLVLAGTATMTAIAAPAEATGTVPHLIGSSAGFTASGLNSTVRSGPVASSVLNTLVGGQHRGNSVGGVNVPGVATLGTVVTTEVSSGTASTGLTMTSHSRAANINLISGLVTADATDTTASTTFANGSATTTANSVFTNLKVAGVPVNANASKNTTINVPGIADVTINYQLATKPGIATTISAAAIVVRLLSGSGKVVVQIDPVRATIVQAGTGYAPLGGYAFAAQVKGGAGNSSVSAGPLPLTTMPAVGTNGSDVTHSAVTAKLGGTATVGAVSSTANGISTDLESRSTLSADVGAISLFGGAITANGVSAQAQMDLMAGGAPVASESTHLVNLKIAGTSIPTNVPVNTVVPLPGIGRVVVNYQSSTATTANAKALVVQLNSAADGLPAGASVALGVATASFTP